MKTLEKIRIERLKKGYSQNYMGEQLGLGQRTYGKIERGRIKLTITRLKEIAKILEVEVASLIK